MGLDIKQAIQIGRVQLKELLPEFSVGPVDDSDIRLEEIEREGNNWAITFSFPNPKYSPSIAIMGGGTYGAWSARLAKVVLVDGSNGSLLALKERVAA